MPPPEAREAVRALDEEFIDAIRCAILTIFDAQRGLVVAQLTQAILDSAREGGRPIEVGALG